MLTTHTSLTNIYDILYILIGGNSAGKFTVPILDGITSDVSKIVTAGYDGVMFDVEEVHGSADVLVPAFKRAFAASKAVGLKVGVTTSHSAPYTTDTPSDAIALVEAWVSDSNIDILSPQLYSSGNESVPEMAETSTCATLSDGTPGCVWEKFTNYKGIFAPSVVDGSHVPAVIEYFSKKGIEVNGYIQWKQA